MSTNPDRLFKLLPSLYRIADSAQVGPLRALLARVTGQADALHDNVQQLWDDFFIETCERWVVPYIGDLVGNIPLHDLDTTAAAATAENLFTDLTGPDLKPPGAIRLRTDVAKTISYRRRKGTPVMLEELARDVTGWAARTVEFFTLLDWNQHLEHLRLNCHGCPDLRRIDVGDRVGGPWDTVTHTVDVRPVTEWGGWRHNIPNLVFFLWRLKSYPMSRTTPRPIGGTDWRLTFSPLGQDQPLFNTRRDPDMWTACSEIQVGAPIRPAAFFKELAPGATQGTAQRYYADPDPLDPAAPQGSIAVFANGVLVPPDQIECANLDAWSSIAQPAGTGIKIDARRGRLAIPSGRLGGVTYTVSWFRGFSAPMGGGEYDRAKWLVPGPAIAMVSGGGAALDNAIATRVPAASGPTVILIDDNASYVLTSDINLAAGESLVIQAADRQCPHVRLQSGAIGIHAAAGDESLTLSGLLVEGGLNVDEKLGSLRLLHCTLVPGRSVEQENSATPAGPSIEVAAGGGKTTLQVSIAFSIVGALRLPSQLAKLWLLDSIVAGVDGNGSPTAAITGSGSTEGPPAHVERCTVLGTSSFIKLEMASESIFSDVVTVTQCQAGCVRFSYVPRGSATPQQYRCQPALEIATEKDARKDAAKKSGAPLPLGWDTVIENEVAQWLAPDFETEQYGLPEFAQLRRTCPSQIRMGAEDGSEIGAFCLLKQAQRETNLRIRLDEYLPVGLDAGIVYVT